MWSRNGRKEVIENDCGMFSSSFIMKKWDINMSIDKTEPEKLPLWVRLCNLPLEAWSINGISALASRIVEVQAKKDLPEKIDVVVFGHSQDKCKKDAKEQNVSSTGNEGSSDEQGKNDDGFVKVQSKKAKKQNEVSAKAVTTQTRDADKVGCCDNNGRTDDSFTVVHNRKLDKQNGLKQGKHRNQFMENNWNNGGGNRKQHKTGINGSAGKNTGTDTLSQSYKFEVLNEYEEGELNEMEGMQNREQVDVFISLKKHPTAEKMKEWNNDMVCYFIKRWELLIDNDVLNMKADVQNENSSKEMDDVCGVYDGIANEINGEDRRGRDSSVLRDC
ncbi:zinc knuckle CX2CX4HX4C containing protein [Tanacetum coccineum]